MTDVVIVEAVRTPMGRGNQRNGDLRDVHPVILAAHVLREVTSRAAIDPAMVEDVVFGCVMQTGEQAVNIARQAVPRCGVPGRRSRNHRRPSVWVVAAGDSFRRQPHPVGRVRYHHCRRHREHEPGARWGAPCSRVRTPFPPELLEVYNLVPQGLSAELIAELWHITREQADEFAARSQRRAGEAQARGRFDREIAPVVVGANGDGRVMSQDQGIRPDTTAEQSPPCNPRSSRMGSYTPATARRSPTAQRRCS